MEIIPPLRMTPFSEVQPGDLFLFLDGRSQFYALKTLPPKSGSKVTMVMLGPSFLADVNESFLLPFDPAEVLSFGKDFSILLPTQATDWVWSSRDRTPVWLGVAGSDLFICANSGESPQDYYPCFVNVRTGEIVKRSLPGVSVYTNKWEIAVLRANHPPRTILKYPLPADHAQQLDR
jgi:hypothetical protein